MSKKAGGKKKTRTKKWIDTQIQKTAERAEAFYVRNQFVASRRKQK